jgi:hypothetical protein
VNRPITDIPESPKNDVPFTEAEPNIFKELDMDSLDAVTLFALKRLLRITDPSLRDTTPPTRTSLEQLVMSMKAADFATEIESRSCSPPRTLTTDPIHTNPLTEQSLLILAYP